MWCPKLISESSKNGVFELNCKRRRRSFLKQDLNSIYFYFVFKEMKAMCAFIIMDSGVLDALIRLLRVTQKCLLDLKTGCVAVTTQR